jgi:hypothetical protein
MNGEDDIAAQLPDPPPPAPLRRQAAIGEALRRYDAAHGGQPIAEPLATAPTRAPWWGAVGRPQAAALVTAGLITLIGVPAAWLSVSQRDRPVSQTQLASADHAPPRLALEPSSEAASEATPSAVTPPPAEASMPQQPEAASGTMLAKDEARESEARDMPPAVAVSAAPVGLAHAEPAASGEASAPMIHAKPNYAENDRRTDRTAATPAAMVAPPPPPPPALADSNVGERYAFAPSASAGVTREGVAKAIGRDIIVTSQRRAESLQGVPLSTSPAKRAKAKTAGRGDWNACTIDDPERSLQKCRRIIDPAMAGPKGQAAAHIADGLMRAWRGDLDGAIVEFDRAIAISPRDATAYLNRGLALQRKGEFGRAGADLDRAVRYAPEAARGYYNRSQLLRQRGEAERAEADEDRAVALDPGYVAVVN